MVREMFKYEFANKLAEISDLSKKASMIVPPGFHSSKSAENYEIMAVRPLLEKIESLIMEVKVGTPGMVS